MESEMRHNKLQGQIQSLRSGNRNAILGTLKELRSEGSVSILPELFQVLLVQEDEQIQGEITSLLNDLKDKEAAEVLAKWSLLWPFPRNICRGTDLCEF